MCLGSKSTPMVSGEHNSHVVSMRDCQGFNSVPEECFASRFLPHLTCTLSQLRYSKCIDCALVVEDQTVILVNMKSLPLPLRDNLNASTHITGVLEPFSRS